MNKILEKEQFLGSLSGAVPENESVGVGFARRLRAAIGDQPVLRFAQKCGMSDSLVRKYLDGALPGLEKLIMLAKAADVRVEWLATGEPPIRDGAGNGGIHTGCPPSASTLGGFELISRYDIRGGAGGVVFVDEKDVAERLAFRRDWLLREGLRPEALVLVVTRGDSMAPSVADGDMLLVDTRERDVTEDAIYVIQLDHHVVAKRIQVDWRGGFWVRSDNPQYADQHVTDKEAAQLRIVGRVVWIGRRV